MIDDPVVAEVHETRERILKEFGSTSRLRQSLREIENEFRDRVVRLQPRKPSQSSKKAS